MGEMIQKKFREILDSVSNASDDFVNKYFSDDSIDLDIKVSDDIEEDKVEVNKIDTSDDWFDYKGNIINDEEEKDKEEPINSTLDKIESESEEEVSFDDSKVKKDNILEKNTSNDDIESTIGDNVDISEIEKEIKDNSFDDLNLNYNYDELKKDTKEEPKIKEEKEEIKEEIEETQVDFKDTIDESLNTVETVKDTSYKELSGDELISLLNSTDNGEDFFKEIEV